MTRLSLQNAKKLFSQESANNTFVLKNEIVLFKANSHCLQNETKKLNENLDHTLSSVTHIASEYGDFFNKNNAIEETKPRFNARDYLHQIKARDIQKATEQNKKQLEELEQYGRRENLENSWSTLIRKQKHL